MLRIEKTQQEWALLVVSFSFTFGRGPRSSFDFQLLPASPLLRLRHCPEAISLRSGVRQRLPTRRHLRRTALFTRRGSHAHDASIY